MVVSMHTWELEILGKIKSSRTEDPELVRLIDSIADKP